MLNIFLLSFSRQAARGRTHAERLQHSEGVNAASGAASAWWLLIHPCPSRFRDLILVFAFLPVTFHVFSVGLSPCIFSVSVILDSVSSQHHSVSFCVFLSVFWYILSGTQDNTVNIQIIFQIQYSKFSLIHSDALW